MEQQKLPNVTIAIVLSILSYLCCCFGGLPGAVLAGIAYFLVYKDENKYKENPELYSNYDQLKTAKIMAIIGLVLGIVYFAYAIYSISEMGGWEAYMEQVNEIREQWEQ
ncbi:CCC motif membrane protein [uncultured Eudoraea sp.]|uniref:CCC motif membrane protein n=1 Tax=uncultured Eudoraea sp. TaxID=1035614 RepID=UPI00261009F5|nr:CCC motif membrane protein [uncultured Eudoraea sp.]